MYLPFYNTADFLNQIDKACFTKANINFVVLTMPWIVKVFKILIFLIKILFQ